MLLCCPRNIVETNGSWPFIKYTFSKAKCALPAWKFDISTYKCGIAYFSDIQTFLHSKIHTLKNRTIQLPNSIIQGLQSFKFIQSTNENTFLDPATYVYYFSRSKSLIKPLHQILQANYKTSQLHKPLSISPVPRTFFDTSQLTSFSLKRYSAQRDSLRFYVIVAISNSWWTFDRAIKILHRHVPPHHRSTALWIIARMERPRVI